MTDKEQEIKNKLLALQAKNPTLSSYLKAAPKVAKAMTLPETDLSKGRLEICGGCDQWTGTTCKKCGCFTKLKVKIPEEKCPLGKW